MIEELLRLSAARIKPFSEARVNAWDYFKNGMRLETGRDN